MTCVNSAVHTIVLQTLFICHRRVLDKYRKLRCAAETNLFLPSSLRSEFACAWHLSESQNCSTFLPSEITASRLQPGAARRGSSAPLLSSPLLSSFSHILFRPFHMESSASSFVRSSVTQHPPTVLRRLASVLGYPFLPFLVSHEN